MTFHIVTLFPQSFDSYLNESILKRAQEDGVIKVAYYNPRDFALDSQESKGKKIKPENMTYAERRVDDKPYGGGPGMVIEALPVIRAIENAIEKALESAQKPSAKSAKTAKLKGSVKSKGSTKPEKSAKSVKIIFFSPSGVQFDTEYAKKSAAKYTDIIFICGRYEGIDARVKKAFKTEEVSVGPFVLTGGELPAMVCIDTIARQVPGVLGDINSLEEKRVAARDVYTRPEVIEYKGKKYRVPKVLLSGDHAKIEAWKMGLNSKE